MKTNITTAFLEWLCRGDPITAVSFIAYFQLCVLICCSKSQHRVPCICLQLPVTAFPRPRANVGTWRKSNTGFSDDGHTRPSSKRGSSVIRSMSCDTWTCALLLRAKLGVHWCHLSPVPAKSKSSSENKTSSIQTQLGFSAFVAVTKLMFLGPSWFSLSGLPTDQISQAPSDLALSYRNTAAI